MSDALIHAARDAFRNGHAAEAMRLARAVMASDPSSIDAHEIIALSAIAAGDRAAGESALRTILTIDPGAGWARDDLARLLIEDGRAEAAEAEIRVALAHDPDHADAHAMLGTFLSGREALVEGSFHLRRAIELVGRHPQLLVNLGRNMLRQGRVVEARQLAAEAERSAPTLLDAAVLTAEAAEHDDDLDGAGQALDRAAGLAAREGRDVLLLQANLFSRGERWREALGLLDGLSTLSGASRLLRGRLRERAGRQGDAWVDFTAGKAVLAEAGSRHYDAGTVETQFSALAKITLAGLPVAATRPGPQPLFILGMPRSGTTMAEQMLSSHSAIRAGGELPFVTELRDFAERMLGGSFATDWGRLQGADHHHLPALFRDFYLARAEVHGLTAPGATFFTDKMPLNEIYLPLLRLAFPASPLVRVRRHPLDVLVSILSHDMTHGFDCGYRLEDAAHQLAAVDALVRGYHETLCIAPYDLFYEGFVADQAGETARLMAFLCLEAEPAQLRFHEQARHAPTPSYAQVREPLHDRSIGRWRGYRDRLGPILPTVAAAMRAGGYSA